MNMTPKQIVAELDRFIIGQDEAKKAVAIALRNRYRRSCLPDKVRDEITPKNIIMKGPTGVGKTEIARRLAKLVKAPFIKVEATKFTEVGYVGRDVESMVRDLVEMSVRLVKEEKMSEVEGKARADAEKKLVEILLKTAKEQNQDSPDKLLREQILADLRGGKLDKQVVELEVADMPKPIDLGPGGTAAIDIGDIFGGMMPKRKKKRKLTVKDALKILIIEESEKHIDSDGINTEAVRRAENEGIIFIDEIDKIAGRSNTSGPDVSREGVQRDILPIVEGSTVSTKYGNIKTDYILFIAGGAFHIAKIEDLIPELQGRFPIQVELHSLTYEDFVAILTKPENAITRQYASLLAVDNINLVFSKDAINEMSKIAVVENETAEDIGARRLHTIMESLLEDVSYNASGDHPMIDVNIDKKYVQEHLKRTVKKHDLRRFIL